METYHITTEQNGSFNFLTTAKSQKEALGNLILSSEDFKRIVNDDEDMIITIKKIKP